ncbi:2-dehydro-3-deoxyglucarate aldolase [Candidatus Poribacteria bacterium]|nr:2-dehydro-3-deoxyglucarate aldolase [Candidatus Poribacteria bacterium]
MKKNIVKEKLASGKPSVGTWLNLCSPFAAEYMAHVGWDWLVVDTEHSPVDMETTAHCFQAICTTETIPMARVAWNMPVLVKRLLDAGALGLVVPMVNSPEEAERAVKSMKYPPDGFRSIGGGRCTLYGPDYRTRANEEILVVVQIEHIDAVKRAGEILSVEGVDACFIGPNDLAGSMGVRPGSPEHEEAVMSVLKAAKEVGVAPGIHVFSADDANRRIEQGFQFIAVSSDLGFLLSQARSEFAKLNNGWNI